MEKNNQALPTFHLYIVIFFITTLFLSSCAIARESTINSNVLVPDNSTENFSFEKLPSDTLIHTDSKEDDVNFSKIRSTVIFRNQRVMAEKESIEEMDKDDFQVSLRSVIDEADIPQRRLFHEIEENPVLVKIKSSGLRETPSWYRRDRHTIPDDTGVKVQISSPLTVKTLN